MATLLADSPRAPSDELTTPDASAGAPIAPSNGASPTPDPVQRATPTPVEHTCARCGSSMVLGQDWCLQCGAGIPGSIGSPGWRSAATILIATAVLALGAVVAAYAALSKGTPPAHVVTTTVAQATAPTATVPQVTTPGTLGTPSTIQPLIQAKVKPPKIPLTATKVPKTTNTTTTPTKTTTTPATTNTGGAGAEPKPTAIVLDTNAASTYNPYNYAPADFGDPSLTIDGDTSTAWDAQVDPATAPKMAEGVLIDLKGKQKLSALELITSTPGMTVQIYGAKSQIAPTSITDPAWVALSHARTLKKKHVRMALRDATKAFSFLTLWISRAPASSTAQAPGHVSVNEIELFPAE